MVRKPDPSTLKRMIAFIKLSVVDADGTNLKVSRSVRRNMKTQEGCVTRII